MACPTCDHTRTCTVAMPFHPNVYWCPRCGTIEYHGVSVPRLVGRCLEFQTEIYYVPLLNVKWKQLGIAESIARPEQQEKTK